MRRQDRDADGRFHATLLKMRFGERGVLVKSECSEVFRQVSTVAWCRKRNSSEYLVVRSNRLDRERRSLVP